MTCKGIEQTTIGKTHYYVVKAQVCQCLHCRGNKFRFGNVCFFADDVDIALNKLTESTALRTVGTPNVVHLDGLEYCWKLSNVVGVEASKGHCEVVSKTQVAQVFLCGIFQLFATLQNFEDEFFVVATLLGCE